jgi:hypothetical protein
MITKARPVRTPAGPPAEFAKFMADETEKWAKVAKFSGAKLD